MTKWYEGSGGSGEQMEEVVKPEQVCEYMFERKEESNGCVFIYLRSLKHENRIIGFNMDFLYCPYCGKPIKFKEGGK